jgi:hypothetical protein
MIMPVPCRLRKKGFPPPAPSLWSLPEGREAKEGSRLLSRVRNADICIYPPTPFFRTLLSAYLMAGRQASRNSPKRSTALKLALFMPRSMQEDDGS